MTDGRKDRIDALAQALESKNFNAICDGYSDSWASVDRQLQTLCQVNCIGHDSYAVAYPKVVIIDGAYNAGLARSVRNKADSTFNAQQAVSRWLCGEGQERIDDAVAVSRTQSKTDEAWLSECLRHHGAVAEGLSSLGGTWPTSFVSKYLHFHNTDYVIFDGVVDVRLRNLLASAWGVQQVRCQPLSTAGLQTWAIAYRSYLSRFLHLMAAAELVRPGTTIKEMDHFLWNRNELNKLPG